MRLISNSIIFEGTSLSIVKVYIIFCPVCFLSHYRGVVWAVWGREEGDLWRSGLQGGTESSEDAKGGQNLYVA